MPLDVRHEVLFGLGDLGTWFNDKRRKPYCVEGGTRGEHPLPGKQAPSAPTLPELSPDRCDPLLRDADDSTMPPTAYQDHAEGARRGGCALREVRRLRSLPS